MLSIDVYVRMLVFVIMGVKLFDGTLKKFCFALQQMQLAVLQLFRLLWMHMQHLEVRVPIPIEAVVLSICLVFTCSVNFDSFSSLFTLFS